jgi:hypothetical protein
MPHIFVIEEALSLYNPQLFRARVSLNPALSGTIASGLLSTPFSLFD